MTQPSPLVAREQPSAGRYAAGPPSGTNRFARWALICGLLALAPVALVFAVIALVQVRRSRQRGKGIAIIGLVAALLWPMVIYDAVDMVGPDVQRDRNGTVAKAQMANASDLRVGDCFRAPVKDESDQVQWVALIPCGEPHDGRIYATPRLTYSPADTAQAAAKAACTQALPAATPAGSSFGYLYSDSVVYSSGRGWASCFTGS